MYIDVDNDGTFDSGESPLSGVPITISGTAFAGTPFARPLAKTDLVVGSFSTTTDSTGKWTFGALPPGTYSFLETQAPGVFDGRRTTPDGSGVTITNGGFEQVSLTPDRIRGPFLFGERTTTLTPEAYGFTVGPKAHVRYPGADQKSVPTFADFNGSHTIALGDLTGDGVADVVIGAWLDGGPRVRVTDGVTGAQLANFFAYEESFRGGVHVAVGDVNGDGRNEIVTGAGVGGGPRVRAFTLDLTVVEDFFAFDSSDRYGVSVAVGDVNGDGAGYVVAGSGFGSQVRAFRFGNTNPILLFRPFESSHIGGAFIAAGDLDGDGRDEILITPGLGGGPRVEVYDGLDIRSRGSFFTFDGADHFGTRVVAVDLDGDGIDEIFTGNGPGGAPRLWSHESPAGERLTDELVDDSIAKWGVFVG